MIQEHIDKQKLFFAFLSGVALTLSFPSHGSPFFAWFALVPLLYAIRRLSFKKSFYIGFLSGLVHYITLLYWLAGTIETYGHLSLYLCISILIFLSAYLALYTGMFTSFVSFLRPKPTVALVLIPALWVFLEYIKTFVFSGFPWELLGYSQHEYLEIIQISDLFGVYGVSFLIVLSNTTFFLILHSFANINCNRGKKVIKQIFSYLIFFLFIFTCVNIYGKKRMESIDALIKGSRRLKFTVVQGNIDQTIKWNRAFQNQSTEKYIRLSVSQKKHSDIVVWPETATPFYFLYNKELSDIIKKGIHDAGSDFIIGSPSFVLKNNSINFYNSAYLVNSEGSLYGKYNKSHLVPFGEYVPFKRWLPFINKMVEGAGDFKPGEKGKTLKWKDVKLGIQICYEIIFPRLSAALTKNNAAILINITNDAWYGRTSAPYQHFSMAVFRAIENRRSLVRSANTGISGFIDACGRVIAKTDIFNDAVITKAMPLIYKKSVYTTYGDIFSMGCIFIFLSALITRNKIYDRRREHVS